MWLSINFIISVNAAKWSVRGGFSLEFCLFISDNPVLPEPGWTRCSDQMELVLIFSLWVGSTLIVSSWVLTLTGKIPFFYPHLFCNLSSVSILKYWVFKILVENKCISVLSRKVEDKEYFHNLSLSDERCESWPCR